MDLNELYFSVQDKAMGGLAGGSIGWAVSILFEAPIIQTVLISSVVGIAIKTFAAINKHLASNNETPKKWSHAEKKHIALLSTEAWGVTFVALTLISTNIIAMNGLPMLGFSYLVYKIANQ